MTEDGQRQATAPTGRVDGRLDSWKEIAAYLDRDVRTAIRWEKREGLPVHRHHHRRQASVYAYRSEIDEWLEGRQSPLNNERHSSLTRTWWGNMSVGRIGFGAGLLLLIGLAWTILVWRGPDSADSPPPVSKFSILIPETHELAETGTIDLAVSPDGRRIVYLGRKGDTTQLFLRELQKREARPIPGTEGAKGYPFFSPDGESVGFVAAGQLKRVSLGGGSPIALCSIGPRWIGGSWNSQDTIVFCAALKDGAPSLYSVSAAGGEPDLLAAPDREKGERSYSCPKFLPDGQSVLFDAHVRHSPAQIRALSLTTGKQRVVVEDGINAYYLPPTGHLIYQRKDALLAASFDLARLEVTGAPAPLMVNVQDVDYAVAPNGCLVQIERSERSLVRVDRRGREQLLVKDRRKYRAARVSPDGKRLAVHIFTETPWDHQIWIYDLEKASFRELTGEGSGGFPVWAPDGQWITFASNRDGSFKLYRRLADGTSRAERLTTGLRPQIPLSWSPDGKLLAFSQADPPNGFDIWVLSRDAVSPPRRLTNFPGSEQGLRFSSDGQWIAYSSSDGVYVARFQDPQQRWWISAVAGSPVWEHPVWAPDGSEIFFLKDSQMMAVSIQTRPSLRVSAPRVLFEGPYYASFDISPDGEYFVLIKRETNQIKVVLNWAEEVRSLTKERTRDHSQLDVQFMEVSDGPEFRTDLLKAQRDGLTPLGLLGWEVTDGTLRAKAMLFPWHDESLRELFAQVCEVGVDGVQELFESKGS